MNLTFLIVAATLLLLLIIAVWIYFPFMVKKQFQLLLAEQKRTTAALIESLPKQKPKPMTGGTPSIFGPRSDS